MQRKCWCGNPMEYGGLGQRDNIWNQSIKLDLQIWTWKKTLWVKNAVLCIHYVGITQILWGHKKKLKSKVYIQELGEGKQTKWEKNMSIYNTTTERHVRWRRVWHASMIVHPDRSTKKMVTVTTIRNNCRSQGKAMELNLTPLQLSIFFNNLNHKPTAL